jgi:transglutaminase-like putative cysteine protease
MPVLSRTVSIQGLIAVLAPALFVLCAGTHPAWADDWLPISAEDLKLTGEPLAPAAPAILLYRQVDRDDNGPSETNYVRIKILTEEGRKFADVEIPFDKKSENIRSIRARTIEPDGSIVNFGGTLYEKPIVQARGVKLLAKTFTLPGVQVGSIVEYRYTRDLAYGYVFNSHWILSDELFTRYAKFSLDPYRRFTLSYSWPVGLPEGTAAPKNEHGKIRLETHNVPAFVTEEYMPPENELKYRVDFIYQSDSDVQPEKDSAAYWKKYGKRTNTHVEDFIDKRRAMSDAVAQIVAPDDTPEAKLRKIYERVQRVHNLNYERRKSEQEEDREKIKENRNAEDVWTHGYGSGNDLALLFLALARAAGIQAEAVIISTRDTHFFNAQVMNPAELNSYVVAVTLDGKLLYLDPGIALSPFGMLPWSETAVKGLKLDKSGGTWITTPLPEPKDSRIERAAHFQLTSAGTLDGKVTVTYTGQEALWRRQEEMNEDDADRRQFLEDQIKADIPSGIEVELTNRPDWSSASSTLTAEYDLKVPGWAAGAGQRGLLPMGLFGAQDKRAFVHTTRVHPIYFNFPHQTVDDITIELPENIQVSSLPQPRTSDRKTLVYSESAEHKNSSLVLHRDVLVYLTVVNVKYFDSIRDFFQTVRNGDEEQVILISAKKAAAH